MKNEKPASVSDYGFTGVHIPPNIWLSKKIKRNEVLVLMEISALSQGRPCSASNQYLAGHLDLEIRRVQQIIAKLIRLGLVVRELSGPKRYLYADPVALAAFDREPTMQKIARLGCNKLHGYHAINCTQVEKERFKEERSTPLNVEKGENRPDPAPPLNSGQGRGNSKERGQREAFYRGTATEGGTEQESTTTPQAAPWSGVDYRTKAVPRIESYEDLAAVSDPILAAMAVTRETKPGGFGYWIKILNRAAAEGMPLDMVCRVFRNTVEVLHGDICAGEIKNPAAALNNQLKKVFAIKTEVTA